MACRGIVGFFSNGVTKGAYHHYDAQPTDLGIEVLNYLGQVDPASLEKRAQIWMKETEPLKAGEESAKWEQLQKFLDSDDKEVPAALKMDQSVFLYQAGCEYAYIVNFDTKELEIYQGPNYDPNQAGRYVKSPEAAFTQANAHLQPYLEKWLARGASRKEAEKALRPVYGVRLVLTIPLTINAEMKVKERNQLMACLEKVLLKLNNRREDKYIEAFAALSEKYPDPAEDETDE